MTATPEQLAEWAMMAAGDGSFDASVVRTLLADFAAALRERDDAQVELGDAAVLIDTLKRERDEWYGKKAAERRYAALKTDAEEQIAIAMLERDALRVRAETAEADADRLARAGYAVDCNESEWWEKMDAALAAHAAAVEARP